MVLLFDQFHMPEDVYEVIFATEQQKIVAKVLIEAMKENNRIMNKTEMSFFATKLHEGDLIAPMRAMGMIDYNMYKKIYMVSDRFCNAITKISIMWQREVRGE